MQRFYFIMPIQVGWNFRKGQTGYSPARLASNRNQVRALDHGDGSPGIDQTLRERGPCLTGSDNDGVVVLHWVTRRLAAVHTGRAIPQPARLPIEAHAGSRLHVNRTRLPRALARARA